MRARYRSPASRTIRGRRRWSLSVQVPCPICRSIRSDEEGLAGAARADPCELLRIGGFRLRRHASPSPVAGWTIVDLVRHAATIDELSEAEAGELGRIVARASAAIRAVTGCERVYVLSFAEAARHVHVHLVPRHEHDPRTAGWAIADLYRGVASGEVAAADEAACLAAAAAIAAALRGGG
jgi:diadenosine tetraphosphate (Ap4A) HIT family hydrolase